MAVNIVTTEDLQTFKKELIEAFQKILSDRQGTASPKWLKSNQVRKILTISLGTLQHLRINGTLPFAKVGGVIYYDLQDIETMLQQRKQNGNVGNSNNP